MSFLLLVRSGVLVYWLASELVTPFKKCMDIKHYFEVYSLELVQWDFLASPTSSEYLGT